MTAPASDRLEKLLAYLAADPDNLQLIASAAESAFEAGALTRVTELIERHQKIAPIPAPLRNIAGLAALAEGRNAEAREVFSELLVDAPEDLALRANLAWARAMLDDWAGTLELLDDATTALAPRAATLRVQALHHLGDLDQALAWGAAAFARNPDDQDLAAALATAALDAEAMDLAKSYAAASGPSGRAEAVRGMLLLSDNAPAAAAERFNAALRQTPDDGRAQLGKGLSLLALGQTSAAPAWIDRAARSFERHAGSWVAAAWAHLAAGDAATSRQRFEAALAVDPNFAEVHGGLAVLDIMAGDLESAKRRVDIALRLDRACFAAALAKMLLLSQQGETASAERIRDAALAAPAGPDGLTLAQALARIAPR